MLLHKGAFIVYLVICPPASSDFLKSNHTYLVHRKKIELSTSHKSCFKMHIKLFLQSHFYGYCLKQEEWKALKWRRRMDGSSAKYYI